jgi:hypothetical protein
MMARYWLIGARSIGAVLSAIPAIAATRDAHTTGLATGESFIHRLRLASADTFRLDKRFAFVDERDPQPRLEERALLFVDLRGSTATAELLGGLRFLDFLNAVFADLSAAIAESGTCRHLNWSALASSKLIERLVGLPDTIECHVIAPLSLRGKSEPLELFALERTDGGAFGLAVASHCAPDQLRKVLPTPRPLLSASACSSYVSCVSDTMQCPISTLTLTERLRSHFLPALLVEALGARGPRARVGRRRRPLAPSSQRACVAVQGPADAH